MFLHRKNAKTPSETSEVIGYVWKLSTHSVTPPQRGNNVGDRTFLESHILTFSHCPLFGALPYRDGANDLQ